MKKSILTRSVLIAASLPLLAGCVEREVVYRDRPAPPPGQVVVAEAPAPPPPQVEVVPVAPDPTFIWIGGSWEWHGSWVWVGGHWDAGRPGYHWAPHAWVRDGGGWRMAPGHWVRG